MKDKIICIVGPTASGKTALAIALAKKLDTEIISADSMQIYKEFNIGVAKPSIKEMDNVVHHMIGTSSIYSEYSAYDFVKDADTKLQSILKQGKIPIIVGGTGFYINALIEGNTFFGEEKNEKLRNELYEYAKEFGNDMLHKKLEEIDLASANAIHKNNLPRVVRAIEIFHQTGKPASKLVNSIPAKYDATIIGINPEDRTVLYDRINKRVDDMIKNGLLQEAKNIYNEKNVSKTALSAIGYKELFQYFDKTADLSDCIKIIKQNTRKYAKRQLTWFRRDERIKWINYKKNESFSDIFQYSTELL